MSILFGCNSEESNESEGPKAALDSRTQTDYTLVGTHPGGGKNMAYNISMVRF